MNPLVDAIPPSLIRAINARKRPGDIDLGLGEPTLRPDPAPFRAVAEWVAENGCPYTSNAGIEELRERIAMRYGTARFQSPAEVCVTVGSEEALYLAVKAVVDAAEDEVLIVEPCYLAYAKICAMEGIRYRMVAMSPEEEFRPSAERILASVTPRTRLIMLNSPANPSGRVWPADQLEELARGLEERGSSAFILVDDVYRELYYGEDAPPHVPDWYPNVLIAGSVSKSSALTGLRLGWLIGPGPVIAAAVKVHQFVNTAASTFSQRVALELFREPDRLAEHRPWYVQRRQTLISATQRNGVHIIEPEGAFYALIRLPAALQDDATRAATLLIDEHRVVTVPGPGFGESGAGWLRISWAVPDAVIEEGISRIGSLLGAYG